MENIAVKTLKQIDPHAFRREGISPLFTSKWSEICDLDLSDLADSDIAQLIEAGIAQEELIPIALKRLEGMTELFKNSAAEALMVAVIAAPARFWIGNDAQVQSVAEIACRLNQEMGQHEYFTLREVSVRDWIFRIANERG